MDTTDQPVPHDRTAQRPDWEQLPAELREAINSQLGSPVTRATSKRSGFSPGFAAVVHTTDHRAHFVKAIHAESPLADWYRMEAAFSAELPPAVPAPRFRWRDELAGHVVLCFEAVVGQMPAQPWRPEELRAALRAQATIATALADPPARLRALATTTFAQTAADKYANWSKIAAGEAPMPEIPPWARQNLSTLVELESMLPGLTADATSMIHFDLRADNILITNRYNWALACDWNWARPGPGWVDTVALLISVSAHGRDVDTLLA